VTGIAELPGTRLWYWDTGGTGPVVVFLHAATCSGAVWAYQQPVLAQAGYRVIGYSRRGYFGSDPGDPANPGVASDDLDHLMDALGVGTFNLVAFAAGGMYGADYALAHPERLTSLAICSTTMGIIDDDYVALGTRLRPPAFFQLPHDVQELGPSYRAGDPAGTAAWIALQQQAVVAAKLPQPKTRYVLDWQHVSTIRTPLLLLTGDADLWTPPAVLRLQATHLAHADVHVVREAAHHAYWEQPETFNGLLLAFLAKHAAPGPERR
jgi:pimeloyl-ACP methyl ester carboxylesterase